MCARSFCMTGAFSMRKKAQETAKIVKCGRFQFPNKFFWISFYVIAHPKRGIYCIKNSHRHPNGVKRFKFFIWNSRTRVQSEFEMKGFQMTRWLFGAVKFIPTICIHSTYFIYGVDKYQKKIMCAFDKRIIFREYVVISIFYSMFTNSLPSQYNIDKIWFHETHFQPFVRFKRFQRCIIVVSQWMNGWKFWCENTWNKQQLCAPVQF